MLSTIGFFLLNSNLDKIEFISCMVYCSCLFVLYLNSFLYHFFKIKKIKKFFRILDHCSVYILEAGTFTPVCLLIIGGFIGYIYVLIIWLITLIGIILNVISVNKYQKLALIIHLVMGWSILIMYKKVLSIGCCYLVLLILGGIFYSIGAYFYKLGSNKKYMHFVFHIFCLLGSFFHYLMIYKFVK